jgi:hypothetical protein
MFVTVASASSTRASASRCGFAGVYDFPKQRILHSAALLLRPKEYGDADILVLVKYYKFVVILMNCCKSTRRKAILILN